MTTFRVHSRFVKAQVNAITEDTKRQPNQLEDKVESTKTTFAKGTIQDFSQHGRCELIIV
jgi:hypothetical protein